MPPKAPPSPEQVTKARWNYKLSDFRLKRFLAQRFQTCTRSSPAWTQWAYPTPTSSEQESAADAICQEDSPIPAIILRELKTNIVSRWMVNRKHESDPGQSLEQLESNRTHRFYIKSLEAILTKFQEHNFKYGRPKRGHSFSLSTNNKFIKLDESLAGTTGADMSSEEMEQWACQDLEADEEEANILDLEPSGARVTQSSPPLRSSSRIRARTGSTLTAEESDRYRSCLMTLVHFIKDVRKCLLRLVVAGDYEDAEIMMLTQLRAMEFASTMESFEDAEPQAAIIVIQDIMKSKGWPLSAEVVRRCFDQEPPNFSSVNAHYSELARELQEPDERTLTVIILLGLVPLLRDVHEVTTYCFTKFFPLRDLHGLDFEYPKHMLPQLTVKTYRAALQKGQHPLEPINGLYPSREFLLDAVSMAWNSESLGIGWSTKVPDHRLQLVSLASFLIGSDTDKKKPELIFMAGMLQASITSWEILESGSFTAPGTRKPDYSARLRNWANECLQGIQRISKHLDSHGIPHVAIEFKELCQRVTKIKENHLYGSSMPQVSTTFITFLEEMLEFSTRIWQVEHIPTAVMHLYNAMRQVFPDMPEITTMEKLPERLVSVLFDHGKPTTSFLAAYRGQMACVSGPPTDTDFEMVHAWYASATRQAIAQFERRQRPTQKWLIGFRENTMGTYVVASFWASQRASARMMEIARIDDYDGAGEPNRVFAYSMLQSLYASKFFRGAFKTELPPVVTDYMALWAMFGIIGREISERCVLGGEYTQPRDLLIDPFTISTHLFPPDPRRVWAAADMLLADLDAFQARDRASGDEPPKNIKMLKTIFTEAAPKKVVRVENFKFKQF